MDTFDGHNLRGKKSRHFLLLNGSRACVGVYNLGEKGGNLQLIQTERERDRGRLVLRF